MTEYNIGFTAVGSLAGLVAMCALYMAGGRAHKWLRRWLASFIQAVNVCLCSYAMGIWSWWLLMSYPIMVIGLSLGYGGDTLGTKILRRSIFCAANLGVGILFTLIHPSCLWVLVPNIGIAAWSIYLGIKNPVYAAAEEVFVCATLYLMTCAYPFTILIQ